MLFLKYTRKLLRHCEEREKLSQKNEKWEKEKKLKLRTMALTAAEGAETPIWYAVKSRRVFHL